jgi:hypothetical protein
MTIENARITAAGGTRDRVGLGVPERPARYPNVRMFGDLPAFGLYLRHARDVSLRNLALTTERVDARPALVADDVTELHVARLTGWPAGETPVLWLNDVRGGLVETGVAREGAGVFLRVTGKSTQRITLVGDPSWTPESIDLAPEVARTAVIPAASSLGTARR